MSENQKISHLVDLGEESQLKVDLNEGIASLRRATESCFQPHICLNGEKGVKVIEKISQKPKQADTEFWIRELLIRGGGDLWLNIRFSVFLDQIRSPSNVADLSPRQTGYIVKNLPAESRETVLLKVRSWYSKKFVGDIIKGLETINEQFEKGDPFLESDHRNRIFDIHGGRAMDVPYTELQIAGEELSWPFFVGFTMFDQGEEGYEKMDEFLMYINVQRKSTAEGALEIMRALGKR